MKCEVEHLMITDGHGFKVSTVPVKIDMKSEKTKAEWDRIAELHEAGLSAAEIAKELRRSRASVYDILRSYGYDSGITRGSKRGRE